MSTSSAQSTTSSTLDGLPKQFVIAMRTLFDIMDDKRLGCVNVADIEARWQDDGSKGLPKGVIESLRKVTPPNGQLSFERFCAGLKICLLRNQVESNSLGRSGGNRNGPASTDPTTLCHHSAPNNRPPSAPLLDLEHTPPPPPPPPPLSAVPLIINAAIMHRDGNAITLGKNHLNLLHHGIGSGTGVVQGGKGGVGVWPPPSNGGGVNTAAIRPNVISTQQRTTTIAPLHKDAPPTLAIPPPPSTHPPPQIIDTGLMHQHQRKSSYDSLNSKLIPNLTKPPQQQQVGGNAIVPPPGVVGGGATMLYGPPKPPRAMDRVNNNVCPDRMDRNEIRTALQNWQIGVMVNNSERDQDVIKHHNADKSNPPTQPPIIPYSGLLRTTTSRSLGDGSSNLPDINTTLNHLNLSPGNNNNSNNNLKNGTNTSSSSSGGIYQKKSNVRRREPRRHTLQNGIDYNMLKRMKQIEQEKEVLIQGLNGIEKARDWYMKQIAVTQDKMKYLGRMGHVEHWSEAQQERLELQRARVLEVNRHLAALTDSWERGGLPLHMNLAVQHLQHHAHPLDCAGRLKQQNRLLTEEVGKKTERISILEREKQSLIRELLQNRVPNRNSQEEAVF